MQFCKGYDVLSFEYGLFPGDHGTLSYYAWSFYRLIPFVSVSLNPLLPLSHLLNTAHALCPRVTVHRRLQVRAAAAGGLDLHPHHASV